MCGRAYSPRFLWMWPNARISVMGGEQAASVLATVRRDQLEAARREWSARTRRRFKAPIREQYERAGQSVLLDGPAVGRRDHRARARRATCSGWRSASVARSAARRHRLRRLPDVSGHDVRSMFDDGAGRQPGRDRGPHHAHAAARSGSARSPSTPTPTPARRHVARRRRRRADRPGAGARATSSSTRVIAAALASGAQAMHPGYGFLSENAGVRPRPAPTTGIVFVGPPACGDRGDGRQDRAPRRRSPQQACPSSRASSGAGLDDDELAAAAPAVGFPVLLKPSAGGGGKGMRLVDDAGGAARRDRVGPARGTCGAFGDDTLLLERFVARPRHIEVQVLGRRARQRRPPRRARVQPAAPPPEGRRGGAVAAARHAEVAGGDGRRRRSPRRGRAATSNAGTVEFIVSADRPDEFFFMEMNTRLQVEHPVTEMVYGRRPRRAAAPHRRGRAAAVRPGRPHARGHAIEARVYAEDPARGFLPTGGRRARRARAGTATDVRVDSALARRFRGRLRLRPDARQGDRLGRRPCRRRCTASIARLAEPRGARRDDQHRVPAPPARRSAMCRRGALDTGLVEREARRARRRPRAPEAVAAPRPLIAAARRDRAATSDPWERARGLATRRVGVDPARGVDVSGTRSASSSRVDATRRPQRDGRSSLPTATPTIVEARSRTATATTCESRSTDGVFDVASAATGSTTWLGVRRRGVDAQQVSQRGVGGGARDPTTAAIAARCRARSSPSRVALGDAVTQGPGAGRSSRR